MTEKKEKEYKIEELSFKRRLVELQNELNAPKSQFNKFGNYAYRNCEDIYNAVKPLLKKYHMTLRMSDEIEYIGDRYYVRTTAWLTDAVTDSECMTVSAYAREEETKKGMDSSQITGASSSYARKYALNGLFLIDDVKDSDTTNTESKIEFKNEEMKDGKYRQWLDDFFWKRPERLARFLNHYRIERVDQLDQVITLKEIDRIITKLKEEANND